MTLHWHAGIKNHLQKQCLCSPRTSRPGLSTARLERVSVHLKQVSARLQHVSARLEHASARLEHARFCSSGAHVPSAQLNMCKAEKLLFDNIQFVHKHLILMNAAYQYVYIYIYIYIYIYCSLIHDTT